MCNSLDALLVAFDYDPRPVFPNEALEFWPAEELNRCVRAKLLVEIEPATSLFCEGCGEQPAGDMVHITNQVTGHVSIYLPCGTCGPALIPAERLRQWRLDVSRFIEMLAGDTGVSGRCEEIIRDRVWRLGRRTWRQASWSVYCARGFHRRDTWEAINQAKFPTQSVVFVPGNVPADDARMQFTPCVIALDYITSWEGDKIRLDLGHVEAALSDHAARYLSRPAARSRPKRAGRTATIEQLTDLMIEHIRAARDHALAARDHGGDVQLLTKPSQRELGRMLGVSEVTVSRCLRDKTARELRLLWDLADDVDQILAYRPRPRR